MFAAPGLLALILVEYLRPQEYFPSLLALPLLHVAAGLALLGFVLDLRLGLSRLQAAPHVLLTVLFFLWCLVTVIVRAPDFLAVRASTLLFPLAIYLLVAHAIQSFRALQVVCALLVVICVTISALGVYQGLAPFGCHRLRWGARQIVYLYDGRPCDGVADRRSCEGEGAEPGAEYACERVGLAGTSSIQGRVRFRGSMEDPNELALAVGIALPFAFAFYDRRRSVPRLLIAAVAWGLACLCAFFTKSRGGQLVFLAVHAVYFVKRLGVRRGLALGLLVLLPFLFLGSRPDADASTMERTQCWWVGLHLFAASPDFGVGSGQFTEHHQLTAHNSYILMAAELGLPGLLLFSSILYLAVKIPLQALRAHLVPVARSWALALLASMAGLLTGILFLSYAYKDVLWLYVGLTGILYQAIRRHDPEFRVRFGLRDAGIVVLADLALLSVLTGYTGWKMGW